LVPNQGDGWAHAVGEVRRYFERASGRMYGPDPVPPDERPMIELAETQPPPAALETIGSYLHAAETLGRRTPELHRALAADFADPAFAPEPLTETDLDAVRADLIDHGGKALAALRHNLDLLPEPVAADARWLLDTAPAALRRLGETPLPGQGAM